MVIELVSDTIITIMISVINVFHTWCLVPDKAKLNHVDDFYDTKSDSLWLRDRLV